MDLESLDTQGLLDPNDESLEFVRKAEGLRPMAIYRIGQEFLLCYDRKLLSADRRLIKLMASWAEFAFYVNKVGRRCRRDFMVFWEGSPTGFGKFFFLDAGNSGR